MITGKTRVIGVIGHPIEHSLSPRMHNAAIKALSIDWCYLPFHVLPEELEMAIYGIRGLGIRGLNVTVPHKRAVIPFLDGVSDEVSAVGAVNTISNEDGRLVGYNTDVDGILKALQQSVGLETLPSKVVVLGAGGAARGIVYALTRTRDVEHIVILNRTVEKARCLALDMMELLRSKRANRKGTYRCSISGVGLEPFNIRENLKDAGLVINATPVGMHPDVESSPIEDPSVFHSELIIFDTVYNPAETKLMKLARSMGARVFNGLDMLVYQGARSFEIWTGMKAPVEAMKRALREVS
ncbi:MAG TPA: shikimate dehydrogenase [Candidatus Latescibacteria bacterium]|nr:shikimate dehydrogenase [Candidatus Latescibacterota bacterium]